VLCALCNLIKIIREVARRAQMASLPLLPLGPDGFRVSAAPVPPDRAYGYTEERAVNQPGLSQIASGGGWICSLRGALLYYSGMVPFTFFHFHF